MNKQSNMNDVVSNFFKLSVQYERRVKKQLVNDVVSKIKPYVKDEEVLKDIQKSIPFREKFFVSINKLKFKLRNFKEFYITKNKRNKYQDIFVE